MLSWPEVLKSFLFPLKVKDPDTGEDRVAQNCLKLAGASRVADLRVSLHMWLWVKNKGTILG